MTFNHKPEVLDAKIKRPPHPSTLRPTGTATNKNPKTSTVKAKKPSVQEQMLADAMAQAGLDEARGEACSTHDREQDWEEGQLWGHARG